MSERERRTRSGGTEDNVRDEFDEAAQRGKPGRDASKEAVEEEQSTGAVKDNVSRTSGTNHSSTKGIVKAGAHKGLRPSDQED
jgi:hypothetical protein